MIKEKKKALVVVATIKDAVLRQTMVYVRTQEPGKQCLVGVEWKISHNAETVYTRWKKMRGVSGPLTLAAVVRGRCTNTHTHITYPGLTL